MPNAESMLAQLRAYVPERPLPRDFYTRADYFEQEMRVLWYREWLFVGHECELANAGDQLRVTVGQYPILVERHRRGSLRASSPDVKTVHCTAAGGYVFVCLAARPPDFDTFARAAEPYLLPHRLRHTKVAFESTIVEHANWKLVWENNRECYHCAVNHPELCRSFPEDPAITGVEGAAANPRITSKWAYWESIGLPSKFHIASIGQYRTARMPLVEGTVSFTMAGSAAVRRPLSPSIKEPDVGTFIMFNYPSIWNHIMGDHASSFRMLPISPTETQLTTKWLVHKDAVEGVDYDVKTLTEVWLATNEADRRICQENQKGVMSPAYDPAPYSPVHENGVTQFIDWYASHLEERLTEGQVARKVAR